MSKEKTKLKTYKISMHRAELFIVEAKSKEEAMHLLDSRRIQ